MENSQRCREGFQQTLLVEYKSDILDELLDRIPIETPAGNPKELLEEYLDESQNDFLEESKKKLLVGIPNCSVLSKILSMFLSPLTSTVAIASLVKAPELLFNGRWFKSRSCPSFF